MKGNKKMKAKKFTTIQGPLQSIIPENLHNKILVVGIKNSEEFLEICKNKKGRSTLSEITAIAVSSIEDWTMKADVMRVKGIGIKYCTLLREFNIKTLKDLKKENAYSLSKKIIEANKRLKLSKINPSIMVTKRWVEEAKNLEVILDNWV